MSYVPNNSSVYIAAFSGAVTGALADGRALTDAVASDYANIQIAAGAYAQEVDTLWGATAANSLDVSSIRGCSQGVFSQRYVATGNVNYATPGTWVGLASAVIAMVQSGDTYVAGQGIVPAPGGIGAVSIDIPLATIQAQTSGTPFNIGAVLPTNAGLLGGEVKIITAVSGGSISAATLAIGSTSDAGHGSIMAPVNVFTGAATPGSAAGTDAYISRGGQQLQATLVSTGAALSTATAGHLTAVYFYSLIQGS